VISTNRTPEEYIFRPPRRSGILIQVGLILLLLGFGALGLYLASHAQIGPVFIFSLLPGIAAVILVPFLTYNLYCLRTAQYVLERDGIRLRWGLRVEHIPISKVLWVNSQAEMSSPLPALVFRLPGGIAGIRQLPNGQVLEYMASQKRDLVLIGAEGRIFAISPEDANGFQYTYQRLIELGSLTPITARSVYPSFLLNRVWADRPARLITLSSLALSLILLFWVILVIPRRAEVHLGFYPDGLPGDLAPAVQLLLLPILNGLIVLVDLFAGLFFYRREETHDLAYLIWGVAVVIPIFFLAGVLFILRAS
jgi:hypothetical protein